MKFKVLRGVHQDASGLHRIGEVFESGQDLTKLNSTGSKKFELLDNNSSVSVLDASSPTEYDEEDLKSMKVSELKELAADNEIDIEGLTKKSEIIDRIMSS